VELPNFGEPEYAIIVETDTQQLFLYSYGKKVQEVMRMPCSTGKKAGPKWKSGDSKTPEGVYLLKKQYLRKDLAPIYGNRALTTDYPNKLDRLMGKNGHSIWIHGTNKALKARDSNGCIVLQNGDIDRLANYITLDRTPVVITDRITYRPAGQKDPGRPIIHGILSGMAQAVGEGSYHDFLSFFSQRYLPDINWWTQWRVLREKAAAEGTRITLDLKNIYILKHHQTYTVLFDQFISVKGKSAFAGKRKLFVAANSTALKIVGDEYQLLPDRQIALESADPLIGVATRLARSYDPDEQIIRLVDRWLAAWSAKDIDTYRHCYSDAFISADGKNLDAWVAHKKRLNKKYRFIRVTRGKMRIVQQSGSATVTFLQKYRSSGFKASGRKKLVIRNEDGEWKILRETWEKK